MKAERDAYISRWYYSGMSREASSALLGQAERLFPPLSPFHVPKQQRPRRLTRRTRDKWLTTSGLELKGNYE